MHQIYEDFIYLIGIDASSRGYLYKLSFDGNVICRTKFPCIRYFSSCLFSADGIFLLSHGAGPNNRSNQLSLLDQSFKTIDSIVFPENFTLHEGYYKSYGRKIYYSTAENKLISVDPNNMDYQVHVPGVSYLEIKEVDKNGFLYGLDEVPQYYAFSTTNWTLFPNID